MSVIISQSTQCNITEDLFMCYTAYPSTKYKKYEACQQGVYNADVITL